MDLGVCQSAAYAHLLETELRTIKIPPSQVGNFALPRNGIVISKVAGCGLTAELHPLMSVQVDTVSMGSAPRGTFLHSRSDSCTPKNLSSASSLQCAANGSVRQGDKDGVHPGGHSAPSPASPEGIQRCAAATLEEHFPSSSAAALATTLLAGTARLSKEHHRLPGLAA